jgi:hypothetical protein
VGHLIYHVIARADNSIGYLIYRTGSTATLHWFLVGSTSILFLIGAGLASKGVGYFEYYMFAKGVGGDVAETGDGAGSFRVQGNVWHLTYGNPEVSFDVLSDEVEPLLTSELSLAAQLPTEVRPPLISLPFSIWAWDL